MTYRERREARAERLRAWAGKRYAQAADVDAWADKYRGDVAFNTQPGHIPERARLNRAQERAWRSTEKADGMIARAANIEAAAAHAIYSDDEDAPERLRERIAKLEAERDRINAYNAACRKAGRATTEAIALLDDRQRANLESLVKYASFQLRKGGQFPAYATSNLSGNIGRLRDRLERMETP